MRIKNHIADRLFNKERKLTLDRIITAIKQMRYTPVNSKVVDHTLNWKKMITNKAIIKKILFLGSNL